MKKIAKASDFYPLISALTILIMKVKSCFVLKFRSNPFPIETYRKSSGGIHLEKDLEPLFRI